MKVKAMLREVAAKDGTYPIIIRVSHKGATKLHYTGFRAKKDWWDNGRVTRAHPDSRLVNSTLESLISEANTKIAQALVNNKPINPSSLFKKQESHYLGAYIEGLRDHFLKKGSYTMYRKAGRFKKELEECFGHDVLFEELDQKMLRQLEEHMIDRGNTANTRHKKFKFYSSFFNKAIRDGIVEVVNPFMEYEIKTERGYKEKLTQDEIKAIEDLELAGRYNDTRNLALFSYYCKGMRFENCITAKWSQVKNGRIIFHLVKSYKPLTVKIHSKLQAILDYYSGKTEEYIFPFIRREEAGLDKIKQIGSLNVQVNRWLQDVIKQTEIKKKISFHNFRHAFAANALKKGMSAEEIKDHLGHSRISVTQNYIGSLSDEHLDNTLNDFYE